MLDVSPICPRASPPSPRPTSSRPLRPIGPLRHSVPFLLSVKKFSATPCIFKTRAILLPLEVYLVNSPSPPNSCPVVPLSPVECGGITPLWNWETCLPVDRTAITAIKPKTPAIVLHQASSRQTPKSPNAQVGRVTPGAPSRQTHTPLLATIPMANQEIVVGRRRRALDCPPCLAWPFSRVSRFLPNHPFR